MDSKKGNFVWQSNITKFILNFVISFHFKVKVVLFEFFPNDCNLQSNLTHATTQNFLPLKEGDRLGVTGFSYGAVCGNTFVFLVGV